MYYRFLGLLMPFLFAGFFAQGQATCATDTRYDELVKQYPQLEIMKGNIDKAIQERLARITLTYATDTTVYDVPVVVHIVHDYGFENINDDIIFKAVEHWAQVYMAENPDTAYVIPPFKPLIGNPKMRLHLATIDPSGKPTKGIVRHQSYLTKNAGDQSKFDAWPNDQYINLWFINEFNPGFSFAAAYAYYPSTGASIPFYDGIIGVYTYIDRDKVIPHELGHVLNLSHTWGSTNSAGVACGDDGVDDTPPTMGHTPVGCVNPALYDMTCAGGYLRHYTSVSGSDSVVDYPDTVNSQNIMDYTYCQEMFTKGQVFRMRQALTSNVAGRNNLITHANLTATGALLPRPELKPIADFIVDRANGSGIISDFRNYFLALGNPLTFSFRNASWNDTIADVAWQFSNGATTPVSTSMGSVENRFSQPGWVTVKLIANSNAGSDTLTNTQAVYVADTVPAGGLGFYQPFSGLATMGNWPMVNYYNNEFKWEFYDGVGYKDNSCVRYHSYDSSLRQTGIAIGDYDDLFTPAINLANTSGNVFLNFYTSGAYTSNGISGWDPTQKDELEIDLSTNGGSRWVKIADYADDDLANNGEVSTSFVPVRANQWVARAINIPVNYRTRNTYFRFRYKPGNMGNNLYLDNFSIYGFPAGVGELAINEAFTIYPNPTSNGCTLLFKAGNSGLVAIQVKDLTGRVVYTHEKVSAPGEKCQLAIGQSITPVPGLYFVTVVSEGVSSTQKLVVY